MLQLHCYYPFREELTIQNGVIFKGERVVIPAALHNSMINKLHSSHLGIQGTPPSAKNERRKKKVSYLVSNRRPNDREACALPIALHKTLQQMFIMLCYIWSSMYEFTHTDIQIDRHGSWHSGFCYEADSHKKLSKFEDWPIPTLYIYLNG